ncbi:MAG TPA: NAD-dependent epimerase/dehydratase family protein [Ramlibacter sp.]|uniref:NAD-dependent epimerase/dehydratase family protein n=1 Tax=Ramlibacter sp. TaxID=1917967 RepID=UPI002B59810E|nr:NAD-dependent epimerase/dehydratase family protein [Ramlibacter sp.]HVZ45846.1 NAD-dependent epimerase/dehydratase family protein [Ramlibacter sp.]
MTAPKVLFIGGTGRLSWSCVERSIAKGFDVSVLNRGQSDARAVPAGARALKGNAREPQTVRAAVQGMEFDAVVNFVAFTADDVGHDLELFRGRTGQYMFISSASAYQTPPARLPIVESTPLHNPVWAYSQNKIRAEERLVRAYREENYPVTIVRPSHTYDRGVVPMIGGWTSIARMRAGREIVVHGDGSSLWTLTHARDFAKGVVGLLANPRAYGDSFHITSDESPCWNTIVLTLAHAAGVREPKIVHVPSDAIAAADKDWGDALLGDMAHSLVFDNRKVRSLVPEFVCTTTFAEGAREMMEWFDAHPERKIVDAAKDATMDWLVDTYRPRKR